MDPKIKFKTMGIEEQFTLEDEIIDMFLNSNNNVDIMNHLQKNWGFTFAKAKKLIKETKEKFFVSNRETDVNNKKEIYLSQYQNLLKLAVRNANESGNTRPAKDLLDSMVKLEGLLIDKQETKIVDTFEIDF